MSTATLKETENIKIIKEAMEECWNNENFSYLDNVMSPELILHGPSFEFTSLKQFKALQATFSDAFDETRITITDQFAKDEVVTTRFIWEGKHTGEFLHIPPTGKQVKLSGIEIDRFDHGKVVESWQEFDQLGMMKQLGLELKPMEITH